MGSAIRKTSDYDQDPIEENLVDYKQNTQLEEGLTQDTTNKNLCKNTKDAQDLLEAPTKVIAYIHGKAAKTAVCVDNDKHQLIIDIVAQL
ncbi:hypothetical protein O181_000825 [Austropuccinia psidii MF-1]|uniref:Uncharacterized protein n=1 Tax=Austropuccinia psidii MF-1 TaxID=1389203 RepID=A0A9Q3GB86_9BASI|nr:hypothetical protein [Austropuccinia psidii MF-1]